jgi:tRNA pseudouridine13 synthase
LVVTEIDRQIGIETFATATNGIGGAIKREVEDFVVEEVLVDGSRAHAENSDARPPLGASHESQRFLLCLLSKRNWDTLIAVRNLAKQLNIDQTRIQIAGIKDAKAVTAQYVTVEGISTQALSEVRIKDVKLVPLGFFREALSPFYLFGNAFKIAIRGIIQSKTLANKRIRETICQLSNINGIPNFYGHQRFGSTRAITHLVGKALVKGNLEEATMLFLAKPSLYEHPESKLARETLWVSKNFKNAFQEFPKQLRFERLMLAHLTEKPTDFTGAFSRLPSKLRLLFVHAYQSYLFNRFLSQRVLNCLPLNAAVAGDYVLNVDKSGLPMVQTGKIVEEVSLSEVNTKIQNGRLRSALPIVGFGQRLSLGKMGEIQHRVLDEEGVRPQDFRLNAIPQIRSRGQLRAVVSPITDFVSEVTNDLENVETSALLQFGLRKGSYATILLREIMKPEDPIAAGF